MGLVTPKDVKRGDIWLARLDPTQGSEIQKTRPCLIMSPDSMNQSLRTVTAMPLTRAGHDAPFRLSVRIADRDGLLLGDQLRTLAKHRLVKNLGTIDGATLSSALAILREMFEE